MPGTLVSRSGTVTDLAALHDALGCAATAAVQAFRGDEDSAALSLTEAHAAATEAFGSGSPGVDALNVVFAAIAQAAAIPPPDHLKSSRPQCANTAAGLRTYPA
jgi:uncharacterized membrane protein YdfJ with MMPL/SSD domain